FAKRALRSSEPADWIHRVPRATPPERLTAAGDIHGRPSRGDGDASAEVVVIADGPPLRAEWLDAALDLIAVEELSFLHLRTPDGAALLARPAWLSEGALDPAKLEAAPRGAVLGKSVGLGGAPPALPTAAAEKIRLFRGRWLAAKGPKKPIQHARNLGLGGDLSPDPAATLVILTRALGGGLDRLLADAVARSNDGPKVFVQLASEGFAPAHPILTWGPSLGAGGGRLIYPLADLFDADDRPLMLRLLLERHRPARVLHIGPGVGLFDVKESLDAVAALPHFEHLHVDDPRFPGRRAEAPDALPLDVPTGTSHGAPLPDAAAARTRLGVPADAVVAAHVGDLGFDERPEDLLTAVAELTAEQR
ncbi:MAG: hypothetical protein AAFY88_30560, partial [Acidobacteriota bacterium]